jgi:hypothetical protein
MRKKISALMIGAVILSVLLMPTVLAKKHIPVDGFWSWYSSDDLVRPAGGNFHISAIEHDEVNGTFLGSGVGPFKMTYHPPAPAHPFGFYAGSGKTVFTGTVDGHSGTCVIMWVGNTKNEGGYWDLRWKIISGTDGLANLHGQGTCWGFGTTVKMTGKIHFDPS